MAEEILMPRLSDTMTEGVIAAWHKKVGDTVNNGDVLAEIETDKATMELESYKHGVLLHIGTPDGGKLQVNDLLAIIGEAGEDVSALVAKYSGGAAAPEAIKKEEPAPVATATQLAATNPPPATTPQPAISSNEAEREEIVLMPRLSDTMTEGVIADWQKNVGDTVKKGEVLADIETDKATMELESYKDGVLLYQGAKTGEKIQVNDLLCIIGQPGLDIDAIVAAVKGAHSVADTAAPAPVASQIQNEASAQQPTTAPAAVIAEPQVVNEGRIFASPLAKKIASEKGIDLKYVQGSGDNGRITKIDINNYKAVETPAAQPAQPQPVAKSQAVAPSYPYPQGVVSFDEVPVSQMRKAIGRSLSQSLFTAPHFYVTMSIDMDAAVAARGRINEDGKVKISFNDFVLKATAMALKQHPKLNSSWLGEKIRYNHHINIGVAVAVEDGLLVPVVRFADSLSLSQISVQVKDFAQKAKDKKLQPSDWEGSTFTISNLGMFGVDEFTAIINPPDSCILAISGIAKVPVVKNGQIVPGNVMKVTLSADHRVVDGATGAAFLQTLKSLLEEPLRMLV